jgi:signal transduction histidine kinase
MKRDWVLGARSDKVWEEIWPEIGPRIQRVLEEGRATWDEGLPLFLERYGFPEETYHTFSYSPIYDDSSRIAGMLCVVTEVTERVIGERRLGVLRDHSVSPISEGTEVACKRLINVLADHPLDIAFAALYLLNPSQGRLKLAQHFGALPHSLVPPYLDLAELTGTWPIGEAIQSGAAQEVKLPSSAFIASSLWPDRVHQAMVLPVQQRSSSTIIAVLIAGVSPRRRLDDTYRGFFDLLGRQFAAAIADAQSYEAERARVEALAEIDRAKTAFFSNVSHEFRTPLTLLLGPLEEAMERPAEGLQGVSLESAHRNALRLLRLVNSLLDFSRIEAGRAQAHYVPTDLAAATEDLASVFRSAIERAGLRYTVKCSVLDQPMFVDRDMWEKIVLNLLSNAFKYTLTGAITLQLHALENGAELTVSDTGTGIPPEALPRLFDRFYRVPGAHGRTHEGSGIGLSLARELVKLHGGTIQVESRLGAGTTFKVRIPTGSAHLPSERVAEDTHGLEPHSSAQAFVEEAQRWLPDARGGEHTDSFLAPSHFETVPAQTGAASNAIILLVDDSRDMREYVMRLLKPRFQVISAEDGQQALELIDAGVQPDLVLSDVMMPRLDGFGLLKALRARPLTENTPVIFLSARAGEEARIEGFDVGADDYLVKPFSARELITRINTHVRLARQRREIDQRKDVFLATLAHELRNPLAPIRNAAQVLASPKLEPKQLQWAQTVIQRQVKHMALLLDDLLDIARITQGKLELKKQFITLGSVLDSAVEASRPLLDSKNHRFTVSMPSEPVMLNADALRVSQVISNLLTNAAKYTDAGGHISLTANVYDGMLSLSVKDNGIGMSPESLSGIFLMFSQVAGAADRSEGGLGIGLALVSGLVALHGGTVEAKSEGLGRGSEFIVRLAVARPEMVVSSPLDSAASPKTGRRILVADDNKDAADSLAMILEMAGHEVRVVHDGRAALSLAQTYRPDVALLDIGMPRFNGYEVAKAVRQEPWGAGIYLVALTGWGQEGDRQLALDAGFNRHVTKPIDLDYLEALVSGDEL